MEAPSPALDGGAPGTEKAPSKKGEIPPISKILGLARPELCMLIFAVLLMIGAEATGLINPLLIARAYDYLIDPSLDTGDRMSDINRVMILVLILHTAGVLAGFVRSSIMAIIGERVVARLRNDLYSSILKQEIGFFDEHKTGELVSRLGSDTSLMQRATSDALPEVVLGVIKLVVAISLMFYISAKLAGVTIGFVFFIFVVCVPFGKWIGTLSKSYQNVLGNAQTHSTEALGAMRTVQSFAAEDRERARYRHVIGEPQKFPHWWPSDYKTHETTYSVGFFKSIVNSAFYTILFGVGFGSMYVSLWYGFKLVANGELTLGDLTAFQSYIFQIGGALGQTSKFVSQLMEAQGASGRVFFLLERIPAIPKLLLTNDEGKESDIEAPRSQQMPKVMSGTINFSNVHFSYPSRPNVPVLRNFSLSIAPNSTCALVGSSGAGKSTVVALLQRFYDVDSGSVTVDDIDIRDLNLQWLRSNIGYVQQEPQLFGLSVRENVCYGVDRHVDQEELEAVCHKANAHEFIAKWPETYDTMVGERGVTLSGGQKQRLAIARSLLVDPRILLLDEATSALDAESEHLVQDAIEKAVVGRTVIIVAHRLSTIQRAEQIVVVDDHQIVDVGKHDVLLRRCSKYQDLIKRQSVITQLPADVIDSMRNIELD